MATNVPMENDDDVVEVGGETSGPWPPKYEAIFIKLMDDEVKKMASRQTRSFTKQAWTRMRDEMVARTPYKYTPEQLRNKYNQLRILFNKFNALLKDTGVGWDSTRLTITTPDDVWERLYKVNNKAKVFKKKGMPHYHELCRIFGDTSATGIHAHPSTKAPSSIDSSDPEFQVKQEELDEPEVSSPGGKEKGKTIKVQPKKARKRDSFQANIAASFKDFAESNKKKIELMEMRLTSSHSAGTMALDGGSLSTEGIAGARAQLRECMAVLNSMDDIDGPSYTRAVNKLTSDIIMREVFLGMPDSRKRDWILNI